MIRERLAPSAAAITIAKGFAAAELEPVYARARELCAKVRDPALAFRSLYGRPEKGIQVL
jgi:hypothetical protein